MKLEWKKIYSSRELYRVEIVANMLRENGIETSVINKQDSMLPTVGEIELHVQTKDEEAAASIIKKAK